MTSMEIKINFEHQAFSFAEAVKMLMEKGYTEFAAEQYLYS